MFIRSNVARTLCIVKLLFTNDVLIAVTSAWPEVIGIQSIMAMSIHISRVNRRKFEFQQKYPRSCPLAPRPGNLKAGSINDDGREPSLIPNNPSCPAS